MNVPAPFPAAFIAEHDVVRLRVPLWAGGLRCPAGPPQLAVRLQPPCRPGGLRSGKGLEAVRALLSDS